MLLIFVYGPELGHSWQTNTSTGFSCSGSGKSCGTATLWCRFLTAQVAWLIKAHLIARLRGGALQVLHVATIT